MDSEIGFYEFWLATVEIVRETIPQLIFCEAIRSAPNPVTELAIAEISYGAYVGVE